MGYFCQSSVGFPKRKFVVEKTAIIVLLASAFGPYILPEFGLRLEHLIIYGAFAWMFIYVALKKSIFTINRYTRYILFFLVIGLFWIILSTFLNFDKNTFQAFKVLAAIENLFQPIALILFISWLIYSSNSIQKNELIDLVCWTTIIFLCINSFLCVLTVFYDTSGLLQYFHGIGGEKGRTVYMNAAKGGRYSGVFNQPVESGIAYSLGLFFWVYLVFHKSKTRWAYWLVFIPLFIGGILSVSKVFIFGGILVALLLSLFLFLKKENLKSILKVSNFLYIFLYSGLCLIIFSFLVQNWKGKKFFLRLFDPNQYSEKGVLTVLTAERFGPEITNVKTLFGKTWSNHPFLGFGAQCTQPLDNAYIEFFYYGGIVALSIYITILLILFISSIKQINKNYHIGGLFVSIWILIIGAGLGAPVITINRSSVLIWTVLILLMAIVESDEKQTVSFKKNGTPNRF